MNSYVNGGLSFICFSTLKNTFKIKWIRQFLRNPNSIWNFIPNFLISELGGLNFVLLCNYNIEKIPVKLSNFHEQMLLSWSLIYKHNFSPHRYYIWNNRNTLYKHKMLFLENWVKHGIYLVNQLININGELMSYSEFLHKRNIPIPPKEYAIVFGPIRSGALRLLQSSSHESPSPPLLPLNPTITEIGQICFSSTKNSNSKISVPKRYDLCSKYCLLLE